MIGYLRQAPALVAVAAVSLVLVTAATAGHGPTITSVKVSGGPSHPVFTIKGHNLVVPKPNPTTSPSGQPLCPLKISGNAGLNYGTDLFVAVWDGQTNDNNALLYSGGRYRPALNELDCIGLIVAKHHTPSQITFTLGRGYQQYYGTKPRFIHNGDVIEVGDGAARFATVVHF
jgi:hypothetical protein